MITRQFPLDLTLAYRFEPEYDINKIVFFDIETTGFSAATTYLYLIGIVYYKDSSFHMIQWFSEDILEESLLIHSFFEFLKDYDALIHYNGTGFDLPYLQRKCDLLKLNYSFDNLKSIDIYKKISPYKNFFSLNNYKQKTIEAFLSVTRKDTYDGGALIQVYQSYLGKKHYETLKQTRNPNVFKKEPTESSDLLHHLLLHNEDDLKGLIRICSILFYVDIFEKPIRILQAFVEKNLLTVQFKLPSSLPTPLRYRKDFIRFQVYDTTASLNIEIYEGELKYFYDNYKDYYYLPEEDTVVHKSLALFVDKAYRKKAKASNCYTKKQGIFAPQYNTAITPEFKSDVHDKISFIEIHTDFLLQEETLERYVSHILSHMVTK